MAILGTICASGKLLLPSMAFNAPGSTHEVPHLEEDVKRAIELVQKLASSKKEMEEALPRGADRMPKAELHFCSGLAFTTVSRAGILPVSVQHGRGFVIAKLPGDTVNQPGGINGASTPSSSAVSSWNWSAPLFIQVNAGGLGFTLGYAEVDSCVILDTFEAVQSFKHSVVEVDTDVTAAVGGAAAAALPATAINLSNLRLSDREFTYSLAKGVIVDLSLSGMAYTVDTARNKAAYGEMATPAAILEGGVKPQPEMRELYDVLDAAIKEFLIEQAEVKGAEA